MSGEYWRLLWRRASRFLVRAERDLAEGDYDGSCFNSEETIQLAARAVIYRIAGERIRIHGSRSILARLRNILMDMGRKDIAEAIDRSISSHRIYLDILEESYIMGRYGDIEYGESQGRTCVDTARKALELLRDVEERMV